MVIKNSNTVTLERRGDLTSLYCIIGRYGPAVALTVIAMLGGWAAFLIYRTVKGQRKKDGDTLETEKDINPTGKTQNEEKLESCVESTEESDEDGVSMTEERSDEEPIGGIPGTNQSADPYPEVLDAEWEVIKEYHPGSPPEHPTEDLCETHDQADHILVQPTEGLCQNNNQTDRILDQDEPQTNHCSLRDINDRAGHLTDINVQDQYEQRLNEVELSDACPCETTGEELEINPEHTFDSKLQGSPEPPNENLTEMTLSDTDLNKPLPEQRCDVESQEIGFPDVGVNSYVEVGYQTTREDDMDVLGENVCSHIPQVENDHSACLEYCDVSDAGSAEIKPPETISDPQQSLVDQQHLSKLQESQDFLHDNVDPLRIEVEAGPGNVIDQWSGLESRHTIVVDQLSKAGDTHVIGQWSKPIETRNSNVIDGLNKLESGQTSVADQMSGSIEASEISEMKAESVGKSMDTQVEETVEKTEINIMEATMDNNEWMTVATMEGSNKDYPWMSVMLTNSSTGCLAEMKPQDTSDDRLDGDQGDKKVAAAQPIVPQIARVSFRVHYLTSLACQSLAVTGNQQELGNWKGFVPLERATDGFWAKSVTLPTESQVEWKFVLVEKGEIQRWEECSNRHLETGHIEDVQLHKWWGFV